MREDEMQPMDPSRQAMLSQMRGEAPAQQTRPMRTPPVLPTQANPSALDAVQRAYSQPRITSGNAGMPGNTFGVGQRPPMPAQASPIASQAQGMGFAGNPDIRTLIASLLRG